ncbi:hypothetical protein BH09BAC6_BH09BAC6_02300 [soil metagenome]|jgi:hypothetical protein
MKKQILNFVIAATMTGCVAAGCGSTKQAGNTSDTTVKDPAKVSAPAADTMKMDTLKKKDTVKH